MVVGACVVGAVVAAGAVVVVALVVLDLFGFVVAFLAAQLGEDEVAANSAMSATGNDLRVTERADSKTRDGIRGTPSSGKQWR